jgi:hypothetical protein
MVPWARYGFLFTPYFRRRTSYADRSTDMPAYLLHHECLSGRIYPHCVRYLPAEHENCAAIIATEALLTSIQFRQLFCERDGRRQANLTGVVGYRRSRRLRSPAATLIPSNRCLSDMFLDRQPTKLRQCQSQGKLVGRDMLGR